MLLFVNGLDIDHVYVQTEWLGLYMVYNLRTTQILQALDMALLVKSDVHAHRH